MSFDVGEAAFPKPLPGYQHRRDYVHSRRKLAVMWTVLTTAAFLYGAMFALFPPSFIPPMLLPFAILGGLVVWALPTDREAPTRGLYFLFSGFYVSLIVWPNYLAISLPGLPWITLIRLFGFPMAAILLICCSISRQFREELREVLRTTPLIWKLLVAFVAIQFLSIGFSSKPFDSLQKFIISQVYWTAIFFTSCYVFRTPGRVRRWAVVFVAMALFVSAIGFWEWRISRVPWAGRIPGFLKIEDESVQRILVGAKRAASGLYRVQSTFTTSLSCAEYLALATPFIIHIAVAARTALMRFAAIACVPIIFFTIVNTNARLGALGFFLSFLIYLALWALNRWRAHHRSIFGPAVTLAYPAILTIFLMATMFVGRLHRMVWGGGETQFSTEARITQVNNGVPMVFERPFGHGVGQGADVLGFTNGEGTLTIDSYYLSIGLEYGVLGFIAYYGIFVASIGYGTREMMRRQNGELAYLQPTVIALTVFLVIKSVLSQEANHPLAFMMAGIVAALVYRSRTDAALSD